MNILNRRRAYLSLGTGAVSGVYSHEYLPAPAYRTMTAPIPEGYILETCLRACGHLINWFRHLTAAPEKQDCRHALYALEQAAASVPIGANGLLLLPYWSGVMSPYWDETARGAVIGLTANHGRGALFRALIEGLSMEQWLAMAAVEAASGLRVEEVAVLGGASNSNLFCSILANVLNKPVIRSAVAEPPCLGAAISAAVGAGWFDSFEQAADRMVTDGPRIEPEPHAVSRYDELKAIYAEMYPTLSGLNRKLAAFLENSPGPPVHDDPGGPA